MTTGAPIVLLVDDDEFHLEMIHAQLQGIGYGRVICATSGAQALAELETWGQAIVAIICDLSMPDMDGLVLIRHLAQRHLGAGIVLLSGAQGEILQSAARLVSAHQMNLLGVLAKPCSSDQLQHVLSRLQPPCAPSVPDNAAALTP